VSASLGATAKANAFFGDGDLLLRALKRSASEAAILYAALRTLARHRNLRARLRLPQSTEDVPLSNLSVSKTPYLSGNLRYDTPVGPADGLFAVNLFYGLSRPQLLRALAGLARGRFAGRPGTQHWSVDRLEVEVDGETVLELDGEVHAARRVAFDLLPERMNVCA
jgi:diacylglycerol kinase family enzyme